MERRMEAKNERRSNNVDLHAGGEETYDSVSLDRFVAAQAMDSFWRRRWRSWWSIEVVEERRQLRRRQRTTTDDLA